MQLNGVLYDENNDIRDTFGYMEGVTLEPDQSVYMTINIPDGPYVSMEVNSYYYNDANGEFQNRSLNETEIFPLEIPENNSESVIKDVSNLESENNVTNISEQYIPGTYTAIASGMSSDITVTCTFDAFDLTDISVDVSGETNGIGADIGDEMEQQIMEAQSAYVDGVSGATETSEAVKTAVSECIFSAKIDSVESEENEIITEAAPSDFIYAVNNGEVFIRSYRGNDTKV